MPSPPTCIASWPRAARGAQADLAAQGIRATGHPAAQFDRLVRLESRKFSALVKRVGLKSE